MRGMPVYCPSSSSLHLHLSHSQVPCPLQIKLGESGFRHLSMVRIICLTFPLNSHGFSLRKRNWHKKSQEILQNFNLWIISIFSFKVQVFWEGHKNPYGFEIYFVNINHEDDCANYCDLLRKAELYKHKKAIWQFGKNLRFGQIYHF